MLIFYYTESAPKGAKIFYFKQLMYKNSNLIQYKNPQKISTDYVFKLIISY